MQTQPGNDLQVKELANGRQVIFHWHSANNPLRAMKCDLLNGRTRIWFDQLTIEDGWQYEGWVERVAVDGDTLIDYLRVLRDTDGFASGTNGYYVSFSDDPDGDRGTGGLGDLTNLEMKEPAIDMIIWRAPS